MGITEYDIITGKLTLSGYLTLKWKDEILQWQESAFGGVSRISVDIEEIWNPQLRQTTEITDDKFFASAWLSSSGNVSAVIATAFVGYCDVDVVNFPVDVQMCGFSVISPASDANELSISLMRNDIDTSPLRHHGEWEIIETKVFPISYKEMDIDMDFIGVAFEVTLKRRPQFTALHTLGPLVLISVLNMMIYIVPIQSGERLSFSVTILLALIFFTTNVSNSIPHNSLKIPIMSTITISIITLCSINVIISVIFSRIAAQRFKPVTGCLKSFVRMVLQKKFNIGKVYPKISDRAVAVDHEDYEQEKAPGEDDETKRPISPDGVEVTWLMVVDIFDAIMFYVHLLVVAIGVVIGTLFITDII